MSICASPTYKCSSYGTEARTDTSTATSVFKHTENRKFVLSMGAITLELNKRLRNYSYTHQDVTTKSGLRLIVDSQGAKSECSNFTNTITGNISEDYETTDVTFHYVDLRNDLLVYTESVQTLKFEGKNSGGTQNNNGVNNGDSFGHFGDLVWLGVSMGTDVARVPFVFENQPIKITNKIVCTKFGEPLYTETINSGYPDGIRILMPVFDSGDPRARNFKFNNVTYNAGDVDWYYIPTHREADGDMFFWWADWHKAVGKNHTIDSDEAKQMWSLNHSDIPNGQEITSDNGIVQSTFTGSVAVSRNNDIFLSASFNKGKLVLSKLQIAGETVAIPQEEISELQPNGSYTKKQSEYNTWYPVAPL